MAVVLTPDVEQLVSAYLRGRAELASINDRIYTEIPNAPTFPLVRLTRIGGIPVFDRPLYLDRALMQFDVWGGPKKTARDLAETVRQLLALPAFVGVHAVGTVSAVQFGVFRWLPDAAYTPARPRFSFDAAIFAHP